MVRYDLLKEGAVVTALILVLVTGLALVFSSPDVPSVTVKSWAQADAVDFVTTATSELGGQSAVAQYGPPYNSGSASVQAVGPLSPQRFAGIHVPVNTAADFVLNPLTLASSGSPTLAAALATYNTSTDAERGPWLDAYAKALATAEVRDGRVVVADGSYGPVPVLMSSLLGIARTGGLDGLLTSGGHFYQTDFTRPLLFLSDGAYLPGLGKRQHLASNQWGVMNETGLYPGQTWLWLFTFWYQVPPINTAPNGDLLVMAIMVVLTTLLILVPFLPGVRSIPRVVPIHRLIWRKYYAGPATPPTASALSITAIVVPSRVDVSS
ncbi:MAG: hypothetical protein ACYDGR_00410 [Candidatus Dormibacteria bacterium]